MVPKPEAILPLVEELEYQLNSGQLKDKSFEPLYKSASKSPIGFGPKVIGVTGLPESGKDTLADYLIAKYSGVNKIATSDFLIKEVNDLLSEARIDYSISIVNKSLPIVRLLLSEWSEARRNEKADYWAEKIKQGIIELKPMGLLLLTGPRTPVLFDQIENEFNGEMWRVVRPGNKYVSNHEIETLCEDRPVAYTIINPQEDDLTDFENNIETVLDSYRTETNSSP